MSNNLPDWWNVLGKPLHVWEHKGLTAEVKWSDEDTCYIVFFNNLAHNHQATTDGGTLEEAEEMFEELAKLILEDK